VLLSNIRAGPPGFKQETCLKYTDGAGWMIPKYG
jgi:hypothetical protein